MIRLPDQFDPRAQATLHATAVAGGGSTSTTCSSCVVTAVGSGLLAGEMFATAARAHLPSHTTPDMDDSAPISAVNPPASEPAPAPPPAVEPLGVGQARVLGWLIPVLLVAPVVVTGVTDSGIAIAALLGIGGAIGAFTHVYSKTQNAPGKGAALGIAFVIGLVVAAAFEMFLWVSG